MREYGFSEGERGGLMAKELCDGMDIMRWTEEDEMTKQVSDCCGADMERRGRSGVSRDGITHIDTWCYVCTKCHKPCRVAKEKEDG